MEKLKYIVDPLLMWYQSNKRDLPWRKTKDPYCIWVSEIMLQQTRVEAVKPYYARFLETLPDVNSLAEANEETILKLWEGLGYYSRVRNMQKAAIQIMKEHNGVFPGEYQKLLKLKGIGPYTAGAVGSIAFGLRVPAVDGNVLRVMSRITADASDISLQTTKKLWEDQIIEIMPHDNPGDLNQALMELGATICVPNGDPKCEYCPIRKYCEAYRRGSALLYPVKAPKKERTKEYINVFFCVNENRIAIHKRPEKGLLSSLWELPNADRTLSIPAALQEIGILEAEISQMKNQKHIFTHIEWLMDCYFINVTKNTDSELIWVTEDDLAEDFALPSAFKKILKNGIEIMTRRQNSSQCIK